MQPERLPLGKFFDVPFLSLDGTSVEVASLLFLFLAVLGIVGIERRRQTVRRIVQLVSLVFFFYVVYSCLGVFGMIRNSLHGLTLLGSAYTESFYWMALPLLVVGLADWIEWGTPFQTLYLYIKKNVFEGYAATHGDEPARFYLDHLVQLFGKPGIVLLVGAGIGLIAAPRLAVATLVPFAVYTALDHKEIRFLLPWWPLALALAFAGLVELYARLAARMPEVGSSLKAAVRAGALLLLLGPTPPNGPER